MNRATDLSRHPHASFGSRFGVPNLASLCFGRYVREEDVEIEGDYDGPLSEDTSERPSGIKQNREFEDSLR